jgi:hypothetical protein
MDSEGDCYGDARLASLVGQHADLAPDELRERILREIDAFTGSATAARCSRASTATSSRATCSTARIT